MDTKRLYNDLIKTYIATHKKSESFFKKASRLEVRGGSHNLRLFDPFPFYDVSAKGSRVTDVDGTTYVDFWQGHFANILGHNPDVVLEALQEFYKKGQGLTTGFPGRFEEELAELILKRLGAKKIRFTTSGTLASMYAVMLARAFTKKDKVLKAGGGWHGAQPFLLKGVSTFQDGLDAIESAGLPDGADAMTLVTRFNDIEHLESVFQKHGDRIACFIVEPFIGAGGFIFGQKDYLLKTRELTAKHGALLIFDEVVSGFRFHAGGLQTLYGIAPDLTILGKAIGGGMPTAAVAGREDLLALCGPEAKPDEKVKFEGGTFCSHPATMIAGITFLKHLIKNAPKIYPKIGRMGAKARKGIERIFAANGFDVRCTGYGDELGIASSLVGVHFLRKKIERIHTPEQVWNPAVNEVELREKIFKLSMIQEGFNIFHGYGSISAAHTEKEIDASLDAAERVAKSWKKYR